MDKEIEDKKIRKLSEQEKEFARLVYVDNYDPSEAYSMCGFEYYDRDGVMMNSHTYKKGDKKKERQIAEGIKRKMSKISDYGKSLIKKETEEYKASDLYSRDMAVKACLENIDLANQTIKNLSTVQNKMNIEDSDYAKKIKLTSDIITQNQRMVLEFTKEISKLQNLYGKDNKDMSEKVTLQFKSDVER